VALKVDVSGRRKMNNTARYRRSPEQSSGFNGAHRRRRKRRLLG